MAVAGLAALVVPLAAAAELRSTGPAAVQFRAVGNRGVRVVGRTSTLMVEDNGHVISVTVPLGTLKTGIGLRDSHMRNKYLQATRYPLVRLDVPWAVVRRPPPGGVVSAEATGMLHLHGQTRLLRFRYTARDEGGVIAVDGQFRIDLREYGIEPPGFLGIRLKPEVDARAHFLVTPGG